MGKRCAYSKCKREIVEEAGSVEIRRFEVDGKVCKYYCNDICLLADLEPEEVTCSICTKKFFTPAWSTETGEPQVCSGKCAYEMGH